MTKVNDSTTKELIEQEAERYAKEIWSDCYKDILSEDIIERGKSEYAKACIHGATFALSLPKQDNGDAWDEVLNKYEETTSPMCRSIWDYNLFLKQHYSISKIK